MKKSRPHIKNCQKRYGQRYHLDKHCIERGASISDNEWHLYMYLYDLLEVFSLHLKHFFIHVPLDVES